MEMNRSEFEYCLSDPITFWSNKSPEEVRILLGDETARMVHYDQRNPHHAYDLFEHTLRTVSNLPAKAPTLLHTAAFFHDVGKPAAAQEKDGRLVFYGHAKLSAEIAAPILDNLGYSKLESEEICFYIGYHDEFISWILPSETDPNRSQTVIYEENVHKRMKKVMRQNSVFLQVSPQELWNNLFLLKEADIRAQADEVIRDGILIDSKEHKLQKIALLRTHVSTYNFD